MQSGYLFILVKLQSKLVHHSVFNFIQVQSDKVIFTTYYDFDGATYKRSGVAALMKFFANYISLKSGAVPVVGFFLSNGSRPRGIFNSHEPMAAILDLTVNHCNSNPLTNRIL